MTIKREALLNQLIAAKHSDFVKIVTGIRRCGKSFLLFNLFKQHLLSSGVKKDHIIEIDLEKEENVHLTDPLELGKYIRGKTPKGRGRFYVLIDEIQRCRKVLPPGIDLSRIHPDDRESAYVTFYGVLSGLRTSPHIDVYVTGSNSKLLISDVATEFRGRGHIIQTMPLSFAEYRDFRASETNTFAVLQEYMRYGGLPECALMPHTEEKERYLRGLYGTIYIKDIMERNKLQDADLLETIINMVMSNVAGLTNPTKLTNMIQSSVGMKATRPTIVKYLNCLKNAFLVLEAARYDVKGRHYLDYPVKYYATDPGLRNARINFRQTEPTHLMENVIYCELVRRGYPVDIGVVILDDRKNGIHQARQYEIDFIVNRGPRKIYIQSAYSLPSAEKREQETFSLRHTGDSFKKVVITNNPFQTRTYDDSGIAYIGLVDFLLDPHALDTL